MRLKRLISLVIGLGIISSIAIIYFYIIQKDFTKQHREFLLSLNTFKSAHIDLEHQILQSSIYSYHNQDEMAKNISSLENEYNILLESKILKDKTYTKVKKDLQGLQKGLKQHIRNTQNYLMLNASIKNSLVFLSNFIEEANFLQEENRDLFKDSWRILKNFNDAKLMQDIDYINHNSFLLSSNLKDEKAQNFISSFNLHSNFLIKNYPPYIQTTKNILGDNIKEKLEEIKKEFSKLALGDFKALDIFASILFSVFIFSLLFIIILFLKYLRENKKLQKTTASLEYSLTHDHLTGLRSRAAFEEKLQGTAKPHLLLANVDSFKCINDIYGNDVGNIVLQELASIIKTEFSDIKNASVYRLGGDEFGVLFDDIKSQDAFDLAIELEKKISEYNFLIYELSLHLRVSIASNFIAPILENTDLALKHLKQDYTTRVLEYKEDLNLKTNVEENMTIIEHIKLAIKNNNIIPYFQPIVNLKTNKIEKYEALVRLRLTDGMILEPFKFLEISKKSSYYHYITKAMIEKTLEMAKEFPQYRFSINISMIDILDAKLLKMLCDTLKANPEVANRLDIELLESENLQNIEAVQDFISSVQKYGSKVLLDDFGTGYSNFSYFSNLDIDLIKIDGSIVREIEKDKRKLHMLKSIHSFSNGMNMKNVAEFVENKEVADLLHEVGVEYAQGYYFGKPLERPLDSDEVLKLNPLINL
ncbi:MAG: bifunctional diguanylate cyclase/phosphodiesterase [Sulfurimonas sp.]|uniref:EAL domain-containing protein n=1 Tax=Sulfurimonas sp. TaxID=2022749 RepID=UPI0025F68788|nr:EAL domain-containing protein [Sulfurimonas sp.]MCK9490550.1 bifunctional diguanylate cyclase/phosphodiesterase [Sulfurimonas sp.]